MKIMANSIPKSGTHLLLKLLYQLGIPDHPKHFWLGAGIINNKYRKFNKLLKGAYDKNTITIGCETPEEVGYKWLNKKLSNLPNKHSFGAHCIYSQKLFSLLSIHNIKVICILRDPRSIISSHMHFIKQWKKHFFHKEYMALKSDKDRMIMSIRGGELGKYRLQPISVRYKKFLKWSKSNVLIIKFEDLVGESGGGDNQKQLDTIHKVAEYINLDIDSDNILDIRNNLFGKVNTKLKSATFRKGKIDSWKVELDNEILNALYDELSDQLTAMGYY